jgi:hypothetical protein
MLTAFVFDVEQSKQVEDWAPALERLDQGQLLWLAMHDPTEEEVAGLQETLELGDNLRRLRDHPRSASVADEGERMYVTLYAASGDGDAPELEPRNGDKGRGTIAELPLSTRITSLGRFSRSGCSSGPGDFFGHAHRGTWAVAPFARTDDWLGASSVPSVSIRDRLARRNSVIQDTGHEWPGRRLDPSSKRRFSGLTSRVSSAMRTGDSFG